MKIKTFEKKLGLNKETIANLDAVQMNSVRAGQMDDGSAEGTCGSCSCPEFTCPPTKTCPPA